VVNMNMTSSEIAAQVWSPHTHADLKLLCLFTALLDWRTRN